MTEQLKAPSTRQEQASAHVLFRRAIHGHRVNLGRSVRPGPAPHRVELVQTMSQTAEVVIGAWVGCEVYVSTAEARQASKP